jgi:hypothetical protein
LNVHEFGFSTLPTLSDSVNTTVLPVLLKKDSRKHKPIIRRSETFEESFLLQKWSCLCKTVAQNNNKNKLQIQSFSNEKNSSQSAVSRGQFGANEAAN